MQGRGWRLAIFSATALFILAPVALVLWQSFLSAPFYNARAYFTASSYAFILTDEDFWDALRNSVLLAAAMVVIAVPLGASLAFLLVRTDLPGRGSLENLVLLPLFIPPMVLAFGYIVSAGPAGFVSLWWQSHIGPAGWNIYSFLSLALIVGLTHVPHAYLYVRAALLTVPSDLEEAARACGASPFSVARNVTLPLVWPSIGVSAVLVFFLGFELFGLPFVLGDPEGRLVLSTYLYKLTTRLGTPSYQLMAVVVVFIMLITLPLVMMQRRVLRFAERYATVGGKAARPRLVPLGGWRWAAFGAIVLWLLLVAVLPLAGIVFRSFVSAWGEDARLADVLTLHNYALLGALQNVGRSIVNTLIIAVLGGLLSVFVYSIIVLANHRSKSWFVAVTDYLVLLPRAMPGIVAGLTMFWLFLFVPAFKPLLGTLVPVWMAYTLVWLSFGMRLVSNSFSQIGRELEEAAAVAGADKIAVARDVTMPLARHGLSAAWLLIFLLFVREYSTGIYLLSPGSEVMGSLLVNLWTAGNLDVISALSVVNTAVIALGIAAALRFRVRLDA